MTSINNLVSSALDAAHSFAKSVEDIRAALKGQMSPEQVRERLLAPVAAYYKVPLVAKERGEGVTWDKTHPKFETAKKSHQRLTAAVLGKGANQSEELAVPAEVQALFDKAWAAANAYEQAGKLAATALATAKANAK